MGRTKERYHSSSPPKACSLMAKTDCIQVTKQGRISNVITSLEGRYAEKNTKSKEIKKQTSFWCCLTEEGCVLFCLGI